MVKNICFDIRYSLVSVTCGGLSPCIMWVQYIGGCSVHWGVQYIGEYHEYIGGYNEYIGGYHEYIGGVQYIRGYYHEYIGVIP